MLFQGSKEVIGIDIGTSCVKVVQIKEGRKGVSLKNFGLAKLPRETIVNGVVTNADPLTEAIRNLITHLNIKVKDVVLSISGHPVIVKKISLPAIKAEELDKSIQFEVQQYIPFALEEVNFDYQILGTHEEKKDQMEVMLVAAKKAMVSSYVNLISAAGLNVVVLDIDVFALQNMFEFNYPSEMEKNVALVDIGASAINFNVLRGGVSAFTRDVFIGGYQVTDEIQQRMGVTHEQAENTKLGKGTDEVKSETARELVQKASLSIVNEIQRSLDFVSSQSAMEIQNIYLSGGVAKTAGFEALIKDRTGIPAELVDPLRSLSYSEEEFDPEYLKEMSPFMAVGVGLALRVKGD